MKRIIFLTILLINIVVAAAQGVDGMKVDNLKMKLYWLMATTALSLHR